jgi:hypothetical protein
MYMLIFLTFARMVSSTCIFVSTSFFELLQFEQNIAENDIDKMPKAVLGHFGKKKVKNYDLVKNAQYSYL